MIAAAALVAVLSASAARAADGQRALIELVVNDVPQGNTLIVLRDGELWITVKALDDAGLTGYQGRRESIDGAPYVLVSSLAPAITSVFDERGLTLHLTARPELFARHTLALQNPRPADLVYSRTPSAFANYALAWHQGQGIDTFLETAMSAGSASIDSTFSRLAADGRIVRNLTTLTIDARSRLQRWRAGDVIARAGPLDDSLIVGGLSVSREYGLDPYYQSYPSPSISGTVTTPATVDVYVDGRLVRQEPLAPGPFQVTQLPLSAGLGTTRVVVRDAFGREQQFVEPYYLTTALLRRGTRDYEYVLGVARSQDLSRPAAYDTPTAVAADRVGLTGWLTAGYRVEADRHTINGGPTVNLRLWRLGEIEWAGAVSRQGRRTGEAGHLAYTFTGHAVSLSAVARVFSPQYATLLAPARNRWASLISGVLSVPLGRRISLSVQHTIDDLADVEPGRPMRNRRTALTGTWRTAGRLEFYGTVALNEQTDSARRLDVFAGASLLLGTRTAINVAHDRSGAQGLTTVEMQQSLPVGPGFGYRLSGVAGDASSASGSGVLQYQGAFGRYEVTRDVGSAVAGTSISASGGVVAIGGGLHLTRAVSTSYALVRVPGAAGVRVYDNNQPVGRTDRHGNLLVPNLLPYYGNRLSIADTDLPLDYEIEHTGQTIAPPFQGGALVAFLAERIQGVTGRVVLTHGAARTVPVYGNLVVTVKGVRQVSPIGAQGEFYFENLPAGPHPAAVEFGDTPCAFTLTVTPSAAPFIDLGTVRCDAGAPAGGTR